jgi:DNA-binding FadR family transcriptional regulator
MITPTGEVRRVAEILVHRILDGTYPSGLRLPSETSLAEQLECGRSTIREALRHLADLGLIRSRRGSGAMVLDFRREGTPALLPAYVRSAALGSEAAAMAKEMLRLRTLMACEAARLAARYAHGDQLARARKRLEDAPALESDPAAHAVNELEMYRELVVASRMWPAAWMVNAFWGPLRDLNELFAPAMGPVQPTFQETMTRLFELIDAGDEQGSVELIQAWFESVDADLVGIIELALGRSTATDTTATTKRETEATT